MYKVDRDSKTLQKIDAANFKDLNVKERKDLQEWIANQPDVLGEELLIIQKEYDGFKNTRERADLIALDKNGNIVVIENKLDDSGRNVVWQAIKYASYFSETPRDDIRKMYQDYLERYKIKGIAEQKISDFFDGADFETLDLNSERTQRIIFVSKEFRPEVVSATLWLRKYGINAICVKVEPYIIGSDIVLDVEQVIPSKETEEYENRAVTKSAEEQQVKTKTNQSRTLYNSFWKQFLPRLQEKTTLFDGKTSDNHRENWFGISDATILYQFRVGNRGVAVEVQLANEKDWNKQTFDELKKYESEITLKFGEELEWKRMPDNIKSQIDLVNNNLHLNETETWPEINEYLIEKMMKLHTAFAPYVEKIKKLKG